MSNTTVEDVVINCVNALNLCVEELNAVGQLSDGKAVLQLLSYIKPGKKFVIKNSGIADLFPFIRELVREHYVDGDIISYEELASGNRHEMVKLLLILLYVGIIGDSHIRNKLGNNEVLGCTLQLKLKYILEAMQKRGARLDQNFLNILIKEADNLPLEGCGTPPVLSAKMGPVQVFSSSPMSGKKPSPLRELLQSPPFRQQKVLHAKTQEIRKLKKDLNQLEVEKQDLEISKESLNKKFAKLEQSMRKLQEENSSLKRYREELEMAVGDNEKKLNEQSGYLQRELALVRSENSSLTETVREVMDTNDTLSTHNERLKTNLLLTQAERDRLIEEASTMRRAYMEQELLIEKQTTEIVDIKDQLEELQQCLLEERDRPNRTVEESYIGSPMACDASPSEGDTSGECMADVVVDKILKETQDRLSIVETDYSQLKTSFYSLTSTKEELQLKLDLNLELQTKMSEAHTRLQKEHEKVSDILSQLQDDHKQLQGTYAELQNNHKNLLDEHKILGNGHQEILEAHSQLQRSHTNVQEEASKLNTDQEHLKFELAKLQGDLKLKEVELMQTLSEKESQHVELSQTLQSVKNQMKESIVDLERQLKEESEAMLHATSRLEDVEASRHHLEVKLEEEKKRKCKELEELNSKNAVLCSEVENFEKWLQVLNEEKTRIETENGRLHHTQSQLVAEKEELTTKVTKLVEEEFLIKTQAITEKKALIRQNDDQLLELSEQLCKCQEDWKAEVGSCNEIITQKENLLAEGERITLDLQIQIESFKTQLEDLSQKNENLRLDKVSLEGIQAGLEKEKEAITIQLSSVSGELDNLKVQLSEQVEKLKILVFEKNELVKTKEEEESKLKEELQEVHEKAKNQAASQGALITEKEKALEELQKRYTEVQAQVENYCARLKTLEQETENLKTKNITLQEIQTTLGKEKEAVALQMSDVSDELKSVKNQLSEEVHKYEAILKAKEALMEVCDKEENKWREQVESLQNKVNNQAASLEASADEREKVLREVKAQSEDLISELENTQSQIENLKEENESLREAQIKLVNEHEDLITKASVYEEELSSVRKQLTEQVQQYKEVLSEKEEIKKSSKLKLSDISDTLQKVEKESKKQENSLQAIITAKELMIEEFKSENCRLQSEMETVKTEVNRITEEKATLNKEMENLQKKQTDLESERVETGAQMSKMSEDLVNLRSQLSEQVQKYETILKERDEVKKSKENEGKKLKEEVHKVQEEIKSQSASSGACIAEKEKIVEELRAQNRNLQTEMENVRAEMSKLIEEKLSLNKGMEDLQERQIHLEREKEGTGIQVSKMSGKIESIKNQLSEQTQKYETVLKEKDEVMKAKREEEEKLKEALHKLQEEIKNQAASSGASITEREKAVEEMKARNIDLQLEMESVRAEMNKLIEEKTSLNSEMENIQKRQAHLESEKEETSIQVARISEELESFKNQLSEQAQKYETVLKERNEVVKAMEGEEEKLKEELLKVQEEIKNQAASSGASIAEREKMLEETQARYVNLQSEIEIAQSQVENLNQEKISLHEDLMKLMTEHVALSVKSSTYEEELGSVRTQLTEQVQLNEKMAMDNAVALKTEEQKCSELTRKLETVEEESKRVENSLQDTITDKEKMIENLKEKYEKQIAELTAALRSAELRAEEYMNSINGKLSELSQTLITEKKAHEKEAGELKDMMQSMKSEQLSTLEELKKNTVKQEIDFDRIVEELKEKIKCMEEEKLSFSMKIEAIQRDKGIVSEKLQKKEAENSTVVNDLIGKCQELKLQLRKVTNERDIELQKVRTLEARMVDQEKLVCLTNEESMRIKREEEKTINSLKEELKAEKEKNKANVTAALKNQKEKHHNEIHKILADIEKKSQEEKFFHRKYEGMKKKLQETMIELNDQKIAKEQYSLQASQYQEHIKNLKETLDTEKKEKDKQSHMAQPLKDKLTEAETSLKRITQEKRSLEAQVALADRRMREMKKQWDRESLGSASVLTPGFSKVRGAVSDTNLSGSGRFLHPDDARTEERSRLSLMPERRSTRRESVSKQVVHGPPNTKSVSRKHSSDSNVLKPRNEKVTAKPTVSKRSSEETMTTAGGHSASTKNEGKENNPSSSLKRSVPRGIEHLFTCEDEDELFSNKYMAEMKMGLYKGEDPGRRRLSELQRRNSLYPPHMRSSYCVELQFNDISDITDDQLRNGNRVDDQNVNELAAATESLGLDSPAYNLRKRKSSSQVSLSDLEVFEDSTERKSKRLSISYCRPGPPTPARRSQGRGDKSNQSDTSFTSGSSITSRNSRKSPKSTTGLSTPHSKIRPGKSPACRSLRSTGSVSSGKKALSSIRKIMNKGRSPFRKQKAPVNLGEGTPVISSESSGRSKLRITRKVLGTRRYSVLQASLSSQNEQGDVQQI